MVACKYHSYEDQFTVEPPLDSCGLAICEGWHPETDLSFEGLERAEFLKCLDPLKNGCFVANIQSVAVDDRIKAVDNAINNCMTSNQFKRTIG